MMRSQPPLESEVLVLEPLEARHAHALYASLLDERLYLFIPQDPPVSEQSLWERYSRLEMRQSPDGSEVWLNWAMRLAGTSTYVGTLEATIHSDATAHIAYMVFAPYQGHGYATEGLRHVLDYLTTELHVHGFIAEIDTRNTASIAVVERLGFTRVATVQDADFFGGMWSDEYRFELSATPDSGARIRDPAGPDAG